MMRFEILGEIRDIETIATGRGVYIRRYLERTYGKGRWRKRKGRATVQLADGTVCEAEIHWFEAHGVGRKDFKIKRVRFEDPNRCTRITRITSSGAASRRSSAAAARRCAASYLLSVFFASFAS